MSSAPIQLAIYCCCCCCWCCFHFVSLASHMRVCVCECDVCAYMCVDIYWITSIESANQVNLIRKSTAPSLPYILIHMCVIHTYDICWWCFFFFFILILDSLYFFSLPVCSYDVGYLALSPTYTYPSKSGSFSFTHSSKTLCSQRGSFLSEC